MMCSHHRLAWLVHILAVLLAALQCVTAQSTGVWPPTSNSRFLLFTITSSTPSCSCNDPDPPQTTGSPPFSGAKTSRPTTKPRFTCQRFCGASPTSTNSNTPLLRTFGVQRTRPSCLLHIHFSRYSLTWVEVGAAELIANATQRQRDAGEPCRRPWYVELLW